jgi:heat shock protein HslJ
MKKKRMPFLHFGLLGLAALVLSACPKKIDMEQITAKAWVLETLNGEPAGLGMNKQPRYFQLAEGNRINGFGGCNNFMGSYELNGNTIQVGNLAGTMMACPPEFSDEPFHQALQNTEQIELQDGKLLLKKGKEVLATLVGTEPHLITLSAELENTRWVMRMVNNHTFQIPERGKELFIQFSTENSNRVSGYSGCNRFMGTYETDGNTMTFGPLAGTRMACPGKESQQLEQEVLQALQKVDSYMILGERLILSGDGKRKAVYEAVYD